jgi:alkylhydroperoxidase/carboxymuconolactone decarboxylase family protein YurZ
MATLNGATDKEMAEVAFLASYTPRWSAMLHALQYDMNTFMKEVRQIGEYIQKAHKKK